MLKEDESRFIDFTQSRAFMTIEHPIFDRQESVPPLNHRAFGGEFL
jgi:hypothetical protein